MSAVGTLPTVSYYASKSVSGRSFMWLPCDKSEGTRPFDPLTQPRRRKQASGPKVGSVSKNVRCGFFSAVCPRV